MFSSALPVERPKEWRNNSYHNAARSANNSSTVSRSNSVSSITSVQTAPGLMSDRSRQSSTVSTTSDASHKSTGFRSLFSKKEKKPKEKKDIQKLVLTSKHAAAAKTRMQMNPHYKNRPPVKTAGINQTIHTGHTTAAEQEMRHPHSGPPALHGLNEMPILTRIASGDERDEEDEFEQMERMERAKLEWDMAKASSFADIREHPGGLSEPTSAEQSDESQPPSRVNSISPAIEKVLFDFEDHRPVVVTKNSYGGRFHKNEQGKWIR